LVVISSQNMAAKLKLILITVFAVICIYLISLVVDKHLQLILGCLLLIASLIILLFQRKRE
jgi:hypothetical protein